MRNLSIIFGLEIFIKTKYCSPKILHSVNWFFFFFQPENLFFKMPPVVLEIFAGWEENVAVDPAKMITMHPRKISALLRMWWDCQFLTHCSKRNWDCKPTTGIEISLFDLAVLSCINYKTYFLFLLFVY